VIALGSRDLRGLREVSRGIREGIHEKLSSLIRVALRLIRSDCQLRDLRDPLTTLPLITVLARSSCLEFAMFAADDAQPGLDALDSV
jgi:hypothetical protein